MFQRKYPSEDLDHSAKSSRNAMSLCRAIVEDAEDARQFGLDRRGAMDLHSVVPVTPLELRYGSAPLSSELTSLMA